MSAMCCWPQRFRAAQHFEFLKPEMAIGSGIVSIVPTLSTDQEETQTEKISCAPPFLHSGKRDHLFSNANTLKEMRDAR